jgi:hypothetical protein
MDINVNCETANTKEGCGTFVDGNSTGSVICLSPPKYKMLADAVKLF